MASYWPKPHSALTIPANVANANSASTAPGPCKKPPFQREGHYGPRPHLQSSVLVPSSAPESSKRGNTSLLGEATAPRHIQSFPHSMAGLLFQNLKTQLVKLGLAQFQHCYSAELLTRSQHTTSFHPYPEMIEADVWQTKELHFLSHSKPNLPTLLLFYW